MKILQNSHLHVMFIMFQLVNKLSIKDYKLINYTNVISSLITHSIYDTTFEKLNNIIEISPFYTTFLLHPVV